VNYYFEIKSEGVTGCLIPSEKSYRPGITKKQTMFGFLHLILGVAYVAC